MDPRCLRVDPVTGAQSVVSARGILLDPNDLAIDPDGNPPHRRFPAPRGLGGILRIGLPAASQSVVFEATGSFYPFDLALEASGQVVFTWLRRATLPPRSGNRTCDRPFAGWDREGIAVQADGGILVVYANPFDGLPR